MNIEIGVVIAAAAALAFYFRLIRMQKRAERTAGQNGPVQADLIRRWPPAVAGVVLALAGAALAGTGIMPGLQSWWWLPLSLGFAVLMFAV